MSHRPAQTPCLGDRVAALADGSLRDDVRDRALAHTLTCRACRDALDVERLTLQRLRSLPDPAPSERLMASLLALGGPGGPVPPRRDVGPGMPRPTLVALVPPSAGSSGSVRPGGGTHPGGTHPGGRRTRRARRTLVVAAAGALGAGFVAAGVLTSTAGAPVGPSPRTSTAQLTVQPAADASSGRGLGRRSLPWAGANGAEGLGRSSGATGSSAVLAGVTVPAAATSVPTAPTRVRTKVASRPAVVAMLTR